MPLALALPDQGALQLGHRSQQVQLEDGEGVLAPGVEGQVLGDELHAHPARGQLAHDGGQVLRCDNLVEGSISAAGP